MFSRSQVTELFFPLSIILTNDNDTYNYLSGSLNNIIFIKVQSYYPSIILLKQTVLFLFKMFILCAFRNIN